MKILKVFALMSGIAVFSVPAYAQQFGVLEAEVEALKEDVRALQRDAYRTKNDNALAPSSPADMALRMGEFDENLRTINGKLDEMSYKIKMLDERLTMINRDIDIRIKMLEGAPISGGSGSGVQAPKEKFKAPVANGAPKSILGDKIVSDDDLPEMQAKSAGQIYQEGLDALKANNYTVAESRFDSVLRRFPKDKLAGNAQYWLGEVYYGQKEYIKAAKAFADGYKKYKNGSKGPDSLLKLGMTMKEMDKKPEACAAFTSMETEFPKAEERVKVKAATEAKALSCK